jgi:hypothetical protein
MNSDQDPMVIDNSQRGYNFRKRVKENEGALKVI